MTTLMVAAGGGGDAVAAAMLAADENTIGDTICAIATFSWDRLLIDPLPGPRYATDFTGLHQLTEHAYLVTADTDAIWPARSTLPRVAADLDLPLLLLDPQHGVRGLRQQLQEAAHELGATQITILDVGGDIMGRGDEPTLKSPTADALAAAACIGLIPEAQVLVAGLGLDGELDADDVREALAAVDGQLTATLGPTHARAAEAILTWHPSEVTALLAAAAAGTRGIVEIREGGNRIVLDDTTSQVWSCTLDRLADRSLLIRQLSDTTDFQQVEDTVRRICGHCETDYERTKAGRITADTGKDLSLDELEHNALAVEAAAADRGADFLTMRRLIEAAGAHQGQYPSLRARLIEQRPERYKAPLWRVAKATCLVPAPDGPA
jgi:hypothetical protein